MIFINNTEKHEFVLNKDLVNEYYKLVATSLETEQMTSGEYKIYCLFTAVNFSKTVEVMFVNVLENLINISIKDVKSHNKKMLEAINALLENRATSDQMSYTIAGRSITKLSIKDLLEWRDYYKAELSKEENKTKSGVNKANKIKIKWMG
jgi:hypothetical protein